jgi:hypothetical protein
VILYDLPNRDCNARASNGEICCSYNADRTCDYSAAGDCAAGLNEYETTYVNPFAQVLAQFDGRVMKMMIRTITIIAIIIIPILILIIIII